MSDFYETFYNKARYKIPDFLFEEVKALALPASGAKARWKHIYPTVFERLVLSDMANNVPQLKDNELKLVLQRVNKLFTSARRSNGDVEVFHKAAAWIVKEMRNRKMIPNTKLEVLKEFIGKSDQDLDELTVEKNDNVRANTGAPISSRGFTVGETLQLVTENGKWDQEGGNYVPRAVTAEKTCGSCRFFMRDPSGPIGTCQVIDGPINWFGTSDLYVSAEAEAFFAFNTAENMVHEQMMDNAFGVEKAYESEGSDDDNNTDRKKPKMRITAKELVQKRIKREGKEYLVTDSSGNKILGRHDSRAEAVKQLAAIEAQKNKTEKGQPTVSQVSNRKSPPRDPKVDEDLKRYTKEDEGFEVPVWIDKYVPVAKVDNEKRKVYGIVLEPDEVDTQGDTISMEEVEKAAEGFITKARTIGLRHRKVAEGVELTDSYVTQGPTKLGKTSLKKGTWIIGVKINDDTIWNAVKSGEFTGFSVGGHGRKRKNA